MLGYAESEWEQVVQVQEVVLQALSGEIPWFRAAVILGMSAWTVRRWRERYEQYGVPGLFDPRRGTPSRRRVPGAEVARVLQPYRARCRGFNVRHFCEIARQEHPVTLSYGWVKQALQEAGLVPKSRPRGRHRRRREPRACFGELLHLDGSRHPWMTLVLEMRALSGDN